LSEKLGYFPALDGVRAAAIGLVLFQHFDVTGGWLDGAGLVGVDLFFALSGYLITSILLGEWRQTGTLALTAFYRRRVFRIWPAFLVFLAIVSGSALLRGANVGDQTQATLAAVFSYMNWSHALGHGPASSLWHCWSLSIEEQFYLVWPALLLVLLSRRGVEGVAPVIAALWLVGVLWRLWLAHEGASSWRFWRAAFWRHCPPNGARSRACAARKRQRGSASARSLYIPNGMRIGL
jgi:peptidoglycan/LPS O-acetylase OafA/YrhL